MNTEKKLEFIGGNGISLLPFVVFIIITIGLSFVNAADLNMMIASGIENDKYDEALAEILRQLEDLHSGGLTQEELDNARRTVVNQVRSMQDSPLSLEYYWQRQSIAGLTESPEALIKRLQNVERGQVMTVGRHIGLDLIYFMKGVGV